MYIIIYVFEQGVGEASVGRESLQSYVCVLLLRGRNRSPRCFASSLVVDFNVGIGIRDSLPALYLVILSTILCKQLELIHSPRSVRIVSTGGFAWFRS